MRGCDDTSPDILEARILYGTIPRFLLGAVAGFVVESVGRADAYRHGLDLLMHQARSAATFYCVTTAVEQLGLGRQGGFSRGAAWTAGMYFGAAAYQMMRRYAS